jgi:hypothetical protein
MYRNVKMLMIITLVFLAQMPMLALAQDKSETESKARLIMSDVIGLDLGRYNTKLVSYFVDNPKIYGGLTRERLFFNLTSPKDSIYFSCDFLDGKFMSYDLSPLQGASPQYINAIPNTINGAVQTAMQKYYAYSGNQLVQNVYGVMNKMSTSNPVNTTQDNVKVIVKTPDNYNSTSIEWVRSFNGVDYPTGLSAFLVGNTLECFTDLSSFYLIGNTTLAISHDQAISIAQKEVFQNNKLNITSNEGSKEVVLELPSQPQSVMLRTACREPFTYYPVWQIQFYAEKPLQGTNGYQVGIWADTGEIIYSHLTTEFGLNDASISDWSNPTPIPSSQNSPAPDSQQIQNANPYVIAGVAVFVAIALAALLLLRRHN